MGLADQNKETRHFYVKEIDIICDGEEIVQKFQPEVSKEIVKKF